MSEEIALAPHVYEYRRLGSGRAADVAGAATVARAMFDQLHPNVYPAAFPTIDPVHGDRESLAGAIVRLPPAPPSTWVTEVDRRYIVAGDDARGRYVVGTADVGLRRAIEAVARYEAATGAVLADTPWELVVRITGRPKLIVDHGKAIYGLDVTALAVAIADRLFIDVTTAAARFAGEDDLAEIAPPRLRDEDEPMDVVRAMIAALKQHDGEVWRAAFADWEVKNHPNTTILDPFGRPRAGMMKALEHWRERVLADLWELRPVGLTAPRLRMRGDELPGVPQDRVEEVAVEVELIGRRDAAFFRLASELPWQDLRLQRRMEGPWRVVPWW